MPRAVAERLSDIREAATDLRYFVADMGTAPFHRLPHADRIGYRAVKNALAELGEAAKAILGQIRARHPGVDWRGLAGLRDLVTHRYFGIDMRHVLPVTRDEIAGLLGAVEAELPHHEQMGREDSDPS